MKHPAFSEQEHRQLFDICFNYFAQTAVRFFSHRLDPNAYTFVCMNVDDQNWQRLAEQLVPQENWQTYRDKGLIPIARGVVSSEIKHLIIKMYPNISDKLKEPVRPHHIRIAILSHGVSLYELDFSRLQNRPTNPALN